MPVSQLIFEQAQLTLHNVCADVRVANGEADSVLAKYVSSGEANAVLSGDSDFSAVAGCRWFPISLFDPGNVLLADDDPNDKIVSCVSVTNETVSNLLGIQTEVLPDFCALAGCDYTSHVLDDKLKLDIGLNKRPVSALKAVARLWTRDSATASSSCEDFKPVQDWLGRDTSGGRAKALAYAMRFYRGELDVTDYQDPKITDTTTLFARRWLDPILKSSRNFLRMEIEDVSPDSPQIEIGMRPFRQHMYAYMCEKEDESVTERARAPNGRPENVKVQPALPLADWDPDDKDTSWAMWQRVLSSKISPEEKIGRDFLIAPLLLFYSLDRNLPEDCPGMFSVAEDELNAVLLTMIVCVSSMPKPIDGDWIDSIERWRSACDKFKQELPPREKNGFERMASAAATGKDSFLMFNRTSKKFKGFKPSLRQLNLITWFETCFSYCVRLSVLSDLFCCLEPRMYFDGGIFVLICMQSDDLMKCFKKSPVFRAVRDDLNAVVFNPEKEKPLLKRRRRRNSNATSNAKKPKNALDVVQRFPPLPNAQKPEEKAMSVDRDISLMEDAHDYPELPILEHRKEILEASRSSPVVCVVGDTGCGKSTQLPQYLSDAWSAKWGDSSKVLVTQPRRVAAVSLADRVAQERGWEVGREVGYRIGGESNDSAKSRICFATVGYVLQMLITEPTKLKNYSHLVLDEMHERSMEMDLLCVVIRFIMASHEDIKTRLVVMSATLQANLFQEYFSKLAGGIHVPTITAGGKCFGVDIKYLEDIDFCTGPARALQKTFDIAADNAKKRKEESKMTKEEKKKDKAKKKFTGPRPLKPEITKQAVTICKESIMHLGEDGTSICIFLPGMHEITELHEELVKSKIEDATLSRGRIRAGTQVKLFPLHGKLNKDEQNEALKCPGPYEIHIILASNIAETSLTIPKLQLVIDFGLRRSVAYDAARNTKALVRSWCSQASAKQRSGRTGRVFEGICIRLVSKRFFDEVMPEFDLPDMQTSPLTKLYLQAKVISERLAEQEGMEDLSASRLLSKTVQPPEMQNLQTAVEELGSAGALTSIKEETADLTAFGRMALNMTCLRNK